MEQLLSSMLPQAALPRCSKNAKGALVYGFVWPPNKDVSARVVRDQTARFAQAIEDEVKAKVEMARFKKETEQRNAAAAAERKAELKQMRADLIKKQQELDKRHTQKLASAQAKADRMAEKKAAAEVAKAKAALDRASAKAKAALKERAAIPIAEAGPTDWKVVKVPEGDCKLKGASQYEWVLRVESTDNITTAPRDGLAGGGRKRKQKPAFLYQIRTTVQDFEGDGGGGGSGGGGGVGGGSKPPSRVTSPRL